MLALLEADIGICICGSMDTSFYKYARKFGIQLVSLGGSAKSLGECIQLIREVKHKHKKESLIFIAQGWEEIQELLNNDS
jgi:hypothetical protein